MHCVRAQGVIKAIKSGPASRGGLLAADKILSIDGIQLEAGQTEVKKLLNSHGRHDLVVLRSTTAEAQRQAHIVEPTSGSTQDSSLVGKFDTNSRVVSSDKGGGGFSLHADGVQLFVVAMKPSSPFWGQLRLGDELLEVNGQPVSGRDPRRAVAMVANAKESCVLRVRQTRGLIMMQGAHEERSHAASKYLIDSTLEPNQSDMGGMRPPKTIEPQVVLTKSTSRSPDAIATRSVSLKFADRVVLERCEINLPVGAKACLLGRSGSGKSTLLKTIARLYQPMQGGSVEVLGEPVNDIHLPDVMGYMQQEPVMLHGSVRDNLTIGVDNVTDAMIQESCQAAQVWHEVQNLAGGAGLDADVGFRGKALSGGQLQRICLARCLLRRKPLILLDEPVSAQDSKTIKEISLSLSELTDENGAPATVLAVTHSTDLLDSFSHAVFMLNGRVVECDTKERLLARKGHFYRRMVSTSGLYIDSKGSAVITAERLRQIWLFSTGPILSLQAVTQLFVTHLLSAGDRVIKKSEDANAMYVVVQGTVELTIEEEEATDGTARTRRVIYQAGDDFGVEGLIDNTKKWPGTAKVVSPRAMLIVLYQADVEALLETDRGLDESFGELVDEIQRLRSPRRMQLMWPFFGASEDVLDSVSAAMEPETFDEFTLLYDPPNDPCDSLNVVVMGSLNVLRTNGTVDKLSSGAVFGEAALLPKSAKGSAEEYIRSRQETVTTVRATSFSVVLRLPRERYERLMAREPSLAEAYNNSMRQWLDAVKPSTLMRHWLFACCGEQALALLSSLWEPFVVQEGANLNEFNSSDCVLILSGSLQVRTVIDGFSRPRIESSVEGGGVVNALALVERKPGEFGETVLDIIARSPTLVLRLNASTFTSTLGRLPGNLLDVVRTTAEARARLCTKQLLQAALPQFTDTQIELAATSNAQMHVLVQEGDLLVGPSSAGEDERKTEMPTPPVRRGKKAAKVADVQQVDADSLSHKDTMFIIVKGEISCEDADGYQLTTLTEGAIVSTPLEFKTGDDVGVIIKGTAKVASCIVLCLGLSASSAEASAAHQEMLDEQEERENMQIECLEMRQTVEAMEKRLGLRPPIDPTKLWRRALVRIRIFNAFGIEPPTGNTNLMAGGGSLEEELMSLQQRSGSLVEMTIQRENIMRRVQKQWTELQPLFLPEELDLTVDTNLADLSVAKISEAEAVLAKLVLQRQTYREKLIDSIKKWCERSGVANAEQDAIFADAPGIGTISLKLLTEEVRRRAQGLEKPMREVQARLKDMWSKMQVPEELRKAYRWSAGMPLDDDLLMRCQTEADRLKQWFDVVAPLLNTPDSSRIVGTMLATMHTMPNLAVENCEDAGDSATSAAVPYKITAVPQKTNAQDMEVALAEEREQMKRKLEAEQAKQKLLRKMDAAAFKASAEAEHVRDAEEYEQMMAQRREKLREAEDLFAHLGPSPTLRKEFKEKHAKDVKHVDEVENDLQRNRIIASLRADLVELDHVMQRLELRVKSDALFIALRNVMSSSVWKPPKLAEMVINGPGALQIEELEEGMMDFRQLKLFLEKKEIKVEKKAMAFFLQKVGTNLKKVKKKKPIEIEKFVAAFDKVVTPPLHV